MVNVLSAAGSMILADSQSKAHYLHTSPKGGCVTWRHSVNFCKLTVIFIVTETRCGSMQETLLNEGRYVWVCGKNNQLGV